MGIMDSYPMLRSVTVPLAIKHRNDIEHHKWKLKIMENHGNTYLEYDSIILEKKLPNIGKLWIYS
jgi:hypothetical protein